MYKKDEPCNKECNDLNNFKESVQMMTTFINSDLKKFYTFETLKWDKNVNPLPESRSSDFLRRKNQQKSGADEKK